MKKLRYKENSNLHKDLKRLCRLFNLKMYYIGLDNLETFARIYGRRRINYSLWKMFFHKAIFLRDDNL